MIGQPFILFRGCFCMKWSSLALPSSCSSPLLLPLSSYPLFSPILSSPALSSLLLFTPPSSQLPLSSLPFFPFPSSHFPSPFFSSLPTHFSSFPASSSPFFSVPPLHLAFFRFSRLSTTPPFFASSPRLLLFLFSLFVQSSHAGRSEAEMKLHPSSVRGSSVQVNAILSINRFTIRINIS